MGCPMRYAPGFFIARNLVPMNSLSQTSSITRLLFTSGGRIGRFDHAHAFLLLLTADYLLCTALEPWLGGSAFWLVHPLLLWGMAATSTKRLHDSGRSAGWLLLVLIPVLGPLWLVWLLWVRRGRRDANAYGPARQPAPDYLVMDRGSATGDAYIINDVTQLNPVRVQDTQRPSSNEALQHLLRTTQGPVSVGGGRFSMGGQTASADSLHLDLRGLNQVTAFSKEERWIRVQAGVRWCDVQRFIDPHDLSVKIMQSYANFTVGGTLSVNAHGRYLGLGPVVLSVRWIDLVLADGSLVRASRDENAELFFAAIGGYGAIGIIVEAELELAANEPVERISCTMARQDYAVFFQQTVRDDVSAVFHNGDLYPPHFQRIRPVTWRQTHRGPTTKTRLMPPRARHPLSSYILWACSETPFGHWRRERLLEPLLHWRRKVHWRNYEAGYDVAELEPLSRARSTYVLQEYFVPVACFDAFSTEMAEILQRHRVNVLNISVRHSIADPGTLLAWARQEVFAFVLYHKQRTGEAACQAVGVWTRELIESALRQGGAYYLPYQAHATAGQFHRAYPRARELFALKQRLDPDFRLRHVLWDTYYQPTPDPANA